MEYELGQTTLDNYAGKVIVSCEDTPKHGGRFSILESSHLRFARIEKNAGTHALRVACMCWRLILCSPYLYQFAALGTARELISGGNSRSSSVAVLSL